MIVQENFNIVSIILFPFLASYFMFWARKWSFTLMKLKGKNKEWMLCEPRSGFVFGSQLESGFNFGPKHRNLESVYVQTIKTK